MMGYPYFGKPSYIRHKIWVSPAMNIYKATSWEASSCSRDLSPDTWHLSVPFVGVGTATHWRMHWDSGQFCTYWGSRLRGPFRNQWSQVRITNCSRCSVQIFLFGDCSRHISKLIVTDGSRKTDVTHVCLEDLNALEYKDLQTCICASPPESVALLLSRSPKTTVYNCAIWCSLTCAFQAGGATRQ